jgi:hypothetical protein
MLKEGMTKLEACKVWVKEFNAIPQQLIQKAYPNLEEDGLNILVTEKVCANCDSTEYTAEGGENEGDEDILTCMNCGENDFIEKYDLPMWGTMWTFGESLDDDWARENLETMRDCGFWVYESDELGILFGIDGAGYDFYEQHWLPLYNARGLQWHDKE